MATNYKFGPFRLDTDAQTLFRGATVTELGRRPVALLRVLVQRPGDLISKEALIEAAWSGQVVEDSNLPVQIAALRRVLGEEPGGDHWIETLPRRGYRYVGPAVVIQEGADHIVLPRDRQPNELASTQSARHHPSIAVLPFLNLSGRPEQQYFGDAIADDIITALTRFRWFFVVARNSSFAFRDSATDVRQIASQLGVRYVLEGSHRQFGQRVRIAAQLVDAASGSNIWAERYERDVADIFAIQDEITDSVVGAIEPELLKTESRLSVAHRDVDATAWDLVRRGVWHFHKISRETHEQARDFFRSAVKLDPQLPEAHIWLARVCGGIAFWGWSDDPDTVLKEGLTAALTAIRLNEKDPYAHYGLAITSCAANQLEQGRQAAERAVELSPGFALGHLVLGLAKLYAGHAQNAKVSLKHGLRLNAYDPHNFVWFDLLALAHLFTGETEQAIEAATKAIRLRPAWHWTHETMAICFAAAGRMDEARQHIEAMNQASVRPTTVLHLLKAGNPQWGHEIDSLLLKAKSSH
jgi:TolB-like protein